MTLQFFALVSAWLLFPFLSYKNVTRKGKNLYYVYICPTHTRDQASCSKKYLHETKLKEILWETLRQEIALAGNLKELVQQYGCSMQAINREIAVKREITAVKQTLSRAGMLYDSLFQNYADKLMTEREYLEMKQKYRADMEQAQARLDALEQQQKDEIHRTAENPWMTACCQFQEEPSLTEDMAHVLIERVEIDAENHINITLRYQDEYHALLQLLEAGGEAVSI